MKTFCIPGVVVADPAIDIAKHQHISSGIRIDTSGRKQAGCLGLPENVKNGMAPIIHTEARTVMFFGSVRAKVNLRFTRTCEKLTHRSPCSTAGHLEGVRLD